MADFVATDRSRHTFGNCQVYLFADQGHGKALNRFAGGANALPNVDAEAMQWAFDENAVKFAVAERTARMGTTIVNGRDAIANAKHRNLQARTDLDNFCAVVRDVGTIDDDLRQICLPIF